MIKMAELFWLPVCILVICAAIPLAKRDTDASRVSDRQNLDKDRSQDNGEIINDFHEVFEMLRKASEIPSHLNNAQDFAGNSKASHKRPLTLNSRILKPIRKLNILTRKFHSEIQMIYKSFEQKKFSLKDSNSLGRIREYLIQNLPPSLLRNKALHNDGSSSKWSKEGGGTSIPHEATKNDTSNVTLNNKTTDTETVHQESQPNSSKRQHGDPNSDKGITSDTQTKKPGYTFEGEESPQNKGLLRRRQLQSGSRQNHNHQQQHRLRKQQQPLPLQQPFSSWQKNLTSTEDIVSLISDQPTNTSVAAENLFLESMTSCEHVTGLYEPRWLRMVVYCPDYWTNHSVKAQCESWYALDTLTYLDTLTFLPVQDSKGNVYANVYCAMCHNVHNIHPWSTSFVCHNLDEESISVPSITNMTLLYTYLTESNCERQIIPSMPEALQECQHQENSRLANIRRSTYHAKSSGTSSYPVSFNVLMNFDFTGNTHLLFSAGQQVIQEDYIPRCREWETYDPYIESCRPITCSRYYKLVGNKCVPIDDNSQATDTITDLSQLRSVDQTAIVSLSVNITCLDYLMMKHQDIELDIVPQIAANLNISVDRIKDVNITYEMGSINGTSFEVTTLTEEQYSKLFPPLESGEHPDENKTSSLIQKSLVTDVVLSPGKSAGADSQTLEIKLKDIEEKESPAPKEDDFVSGKSSKPSTPEPQSDQSSSTENHTNGEYSLDGRLFSELGIPALNASLGKLFSNNPSKSNQLEENFKKVRYQSGGSQKAGLVKMPVEENKNNSGKAGDSGEETKSKETKNESKNDGAFVISQPETYIYHIKTPDAIVDFYISTLVNSENERILVETQSPDMLKVLRNQMVMKISFVLVPPHDPQSTEEGAQTLLQKIYNLIVEEQFSLKVNGNQFDVIAADDDRNLETDTKEFCPWGVEYMVYDDEFMILNVDNVTLMYINITNSYVGVGRFDLYVMVTGSNNAEQTNVTDLVQYAFVCFMPQISQVDCNRINLTPDEYKVIADNKSIIFEEKEYDMFSYRVLDEITGSVQICVPQSFNSADKTFLPHIVTVDSGCSHDFDKTLEAEGYMTLVLGRISIFALVCVLVTYILFPKLRNLPGINTMNLTLCLLVTQIIFAEGILEDAEWLCTAVAISLHYSLLAAHFWMNVMSYDVYVTFTNPTALIRIREARKYFPRYALYAWGMPLIIVSFCVFVDMSGLFEGVSIGYGGALTNPSNDLNISAYNYTDPDEDDANATIVEKNSPGAETRWCWITRPLAALVAFGAPILIIFLANCIFFFRTIVSISRTAKIAKKSLTSRHSNSSLHKMTGRADVMLYVRMSTVMGFTWIFGLSSSILSSFAKPATYAACIVIHVVGILFIILNTSQGIFIFGAFVCNRRVFGLYKSLAHNIKKYIFRQFPQGSIYSVSSTVATSKTTISSEANRQER